MACPDFDISTIPVQGDVPDSITTGDFDGDGNLDLAIVNRESDTVEIYLGDGNGGFSLAMGSPFSSGGNDPVSIISDDFDGDGDMDLALVNVSSDNVAVFFNQGGGQFAPAMGSPFSSGGDAPVAIVSGDFDGDGNLDLAVINNDSSDVAVFLNQGGGQFTPAAGSPFPSGGTQPTAITSADFDGDGDLDLAITHTFGGVSVFLNNGSGEFSQFTTLTDEISQPFAIIAADLVCNGIQDLIVGNNSDEITVFLGDGTGDFPDFQTFQSPGGAIQISITAGDFDGDGRTDLAVANPTTNTFSVFINTCTFVPQPICPGNITMSNDPGECGAIVEFETNIDDPCGIVVSIECSPESGDFFPVGTTTVTCTALGAEGNESLPCTFDVTVDDTEPPSISCSDDITVLVAPGETGAFVNYPAPTVSDNCTDVNDIRVVCMPESGSFFPLGETKVCCAAVDEARNINLCSFTVTVQCDGEPPTIICPADITEFVPPGESGTNVNFPDPTLDGECIDDVQVICVPESGSFFPLGNTTVTCFAIQGTELVSTCSFNVRVLCDGEPPAITCPPDITVFNDPGKKGAVVHFPSPTIQGDCLDNVKVVCVPESGSFFPPGDTTVICVAVDEAMNVNACSFNVKVLLHPCLYFNSRICKD